MWGRELGVTMAIHPKSCLFWSWRYPPSQTPPSDNSNSTQSWLHLELWSGAAPPRVGVMPNRAYMKGSSLHIISTSLATLPMHASFHSSFKLLLAYTTQTWIWNLKLVSWKQTYVMHKQMQYTSLWACPPYLCASNFNWSPYNVISFVCSPYLYYLCEFFSLFVIN